MEICFCGRYSIFFYNFVRWKLGHLWSYTLNDVYQYKPAVEHGAKVHYANHVEEWFNLVVARSSHIDDTVSHNIQSAEHLNVPTDATLRPTNQQVNNQLIRTSHSMIHQPTNQIKLLLIELSFINMNIYVFIIEIG